MKILIFFCILFFASISFAENIGLMRELPENNSQNEQEIFTHNTVQVIKSFKNTPILIDYFNLVDWSILKNETNETKDKKIYHTLKSFFKKHHIKKIVIAGDSYNYNEPPYHPEPKARFHFTRVLAKMMKNNEIKVFGICGGMQGILFFNGVELDSVKNILKNSNKDTRKYQNGEKYLNRNNEQYLYDKKKFKSCSGPLNKIFIDNNSYLGSLMIKAEKKHKIKYQRNENGFLITNVAMAHFHAAKNSKENVEKIKKNGFQISGFSQDNIIYIVEDKNHNILIQGHPEFSANILRCPCRAKEDVVFARLLFANLMKKRN